MGWMNVLKYEFNWQNYCVLIGMPIPLSSFTAWQTYFAHLIQMRSRWLEYKVFVDKRRDRVYQAIGTTNYGYQAIVYRAIADQVGMCDLSILDEPLAWRLQPHSLIEVANGLRKHLMLFGTLPMDYVAAVHTAWQNESMALGDIIIVRHGVPMLGNFCKNPVTNICSIGIGYVAPNGFGGHTLGLDHDVHEIIMSFQVRTNGEAHQVKYSVVCHSSISHDCKFLSGFRNAAALIAKIETRLDGFVTDVESSLPEVHTFLSYAELVAACTFQISEGVDDQRRSCFTPCFLFWCGDGELLNVESSTKSDPCPSDGSMSDEEEEEEEKEGEEEEEEKEEEEEEECHQNDNVGETQA